MIMACIATPLALFTSILVVYNYMPIAIGYLPALFIFVGSFGVYTPRERLIGRVIFFVFINYVILQHLYLSVYSY